MRRWAWAVLISGTLVTGLAVESSVPPQSPERPMLIVVAGAPGEAGFGAQFHEWAARWEKAAERSGAGFKAIGLDDSPTNDLDRLREVLAAEPKTGPADLWLVLIGHGTFDGKEARFNLRGPDLTAGELAGWLGTFGRTLVLIDTSSSSAPFLARLSATNRVTVTATRSGYEQNYSRFGDYLSQAITQPEADLDKDGQTSLLEAFLSASHQVEDFYRSEGRLATEHALLDDNGDGLGTPAEWFRGVRAIKRATENAPLDGARAHQIHLVPSDQERTLPAAIRRKRDELELAVVRLRDRKGHLAEAEYYQQLERILIELAKLYESAEKAPLIDAKGDRVGTITWR